jgi:DNA-binding XRE family transcriptional regulator
MDPMDLRQAFAANLRRLRHAKGISQEDLAHEAGINRSYMSKLEKGASYPGRRSSPSLPPSLRSSRPSCWRCYRESPNVCAPADDGVSRSPHTGSGAQAKSYRPMALGLTYPSKNRRVPEAA